MKCAASLIFGALTVTAISGLFVPIRVDETQYIEKNGMKIGPAYLEAEMQKLWEKHTLLEAKTSADCPSPQITTKTLGNFEGSVITGKCMTTSLTEREIYCFQGLRFGEKPDDTTKFKPPIRVMGKFWDGDQFSAIHLGNKCPQPPMVGSGISGNIDCLFLNVYTPIMPENVDKPLPVMFFIYGGGFVVGDSSMYLPTKLLEHDVILVTIHYRLGAQGFFTLMNTDAPGNTALYDMLTALEWVQDNIAEFGGDPDKVTIFGESAGSVSVNYMMISPEAKGLFRGVIAESGSSLDYWALDTRHEEATTYIANYVGCYDNAAETVDFTCMLAASDEDLVHAELSLGANDRHNGGDGFIGAAPVIQSKLLQKVNGRNPLVTKHPKYYFSDGDFNDVAFMTGANRDEGSFVYGMMYWDYVVYNGKTDDEIWMREQMVQQMLMSIGIQEESYSVATAMAARYCPDVDLGIMDSNSTGCMIDMIGALFLKGGSWETCKYHSYYGTTNTFYYSFEFESEDTMYNWIQSPVTWDTGITHSDELPYIFSMPIVIDGYQIIMEKIMTKLWTNFATYLHPTPNMDPEWKKLQIPEWIRYEFEKPHYMQIKRIMTVGEEFSDSWTQHTQNNNRISKLRE